MIDHFFSRRTRRQLASASRAEAVSISSAVALCVTEANLIDGETGKARP
jgi:hypothetical protein